MEINRVNSSFDYNHYSQIKRVGTVPDKQGSTLNVDIHNISPNELDTIGVVIANGQF